MKSNIKLEKPYQFDRISERAISFDFSVAYGLLQTNEEKGVSTMIRTI